MALSEVYAEVFISNTLSSSHNLCDAVEQAVYTSSIKEAIVFVPALITEDFEL